jgi:hypothetical protein
MERSTAACGWVEESNVGRVAIVKKKKPTNQTNKQTLNPTYVYAYNINTLQILKL